MPRTALTADTVKRLKLFPPGAPFQIIFDLQGQVTDFKYLGYRISKYKSDLEDKLKHATK
jgi:hypothetical protein